MCQDGLKFVRLEWIEICQRVDRNMLGQIRVDWNLLVRGWIEICQVRLGWIGICQDVGFGQGYLAKALDWTIGLD